MKLIINGFATGRHCNCGTIVNISHANGGQAENVGLSVRPTCVEHGHMLETYFTDPAVGCECVVYAEYQKPTRYEFDACALHGKNDGERVIVDVFPVEVTVMK